jgi:signal transduction histidine kinase
VGNALKFTPKGAVSVSLCAASTPTPEGRLRLLFSVADTGVGIAQDKLAGIFEPFSRIEHPGGRQADGSGLGLAIVKRLVELMGGSVAVDSEPGAGTTAHFTVVVDRLAPGRAIRPRTHCPTSARARCACSWSRT